MYSFVKVPPSGVQNRRRGLKSTNEFGFFLNLKEKMGKMFFFFKYTTFLRGFFLFEKNTLKKI